MGTFLGRSGFNRRVIRACLERRCQPLLGQILFLEYEDVLSRQELFRHCLLSKKERQELFAAFLSVCEWIQVYFLWRPNLADEGDNHLVELAIAGGAAAIVTNNVRDFRRAELRFPGVKVLTPEQFLRSIL
jgi:uncharacterized protein